MKQKSRRVLKVADPRTVRTRKQIDAAFVTLLQRRSYSGIRVSDITRKAHVGRATFYAHYLSKDDLLSSQVHRILVPMLGASSGDPWLFDCRKLFIHIRSAGQIYRSLLMGPSRLVCERIVQDAFERRAATELARCALIDKVLRETIAARFVAASLLTLMSWWVENDARLSVDVMQKLYQSLVGRGLGATLGR